MVYELGKTISAITLKRFFEDQFSENAKTDLRFIKTLDKLCIFLDFENLNDFVAKQRENIPKNEIIKKESFDDFKNIIKDCGNEEFECIKKLPQIEMLKVDEFVFEHSPYYQRIKKYLTDLQKRGFKLLTENNMSNY